MNPSEAREMRGACPITHLSQFLQPILHRCCQHLQHLQRGGWSGRVFPAPQPTPPSAPQTSAQWAHRMAVQLDTVGVQELQHCQEGLSWYGA